MIDPVCVKVLESIRGEFPELKIATADQLMFVKEDLIIPQHNTFYVSIKNISKGLIKINF